MRNKKKLKQDKAKLTRLAQESISIKSFLSNYLGIRDNHALSNQMSHKDLKELCPQLVRTSFDHIIEDPDVIYDGDVLLVEDDYGSIVPYFSPTYVYEATDFIGEFIEDKPRENIPNIRDINLTELSNYELGKLLHIYESNKIRSAARKVRKELISRKDSHHASKQSIGRVLKKERKNERFNY